MMPNSGDLTFQLNRQIESRKDLLNLSQRDDIKDLLADLGFDWAGNRGNTSSEIYKIFQLYEWTEGENCLSRAGRLVLGRLSIHFDEFKEGVSVGNYHLKGRLKSGKNSVIFEATHKFLGSKAAIKFIRPGASDDIASALSTLVSADLGETVVMPIDVIDVEASDIVGGKMPVTCLVFPIIEGVSFRDFLNNPNNHLNSNIVVSFIQQIGGALRELERIGAYHGDLHAENIIVSNKPNQPLMFRILDISYGAVGSRSLEEAKNSDLELFKQHIWSILTAQKQRIPNVSLRRFIGTRNFRRINRILSERTDSFAIIMDLFNSNLDYQGYLEQKQRFMSERFAPPASFRLQRYEEFVDPSIASQLFVPFLELQEKINEFSNVYVSGNRGSGKSTYLASLAFFPAVSSPTEDFKSIFGVYFPCRQGEFRSISSLPADSEIDRAKHILHLMVLKVIRRTLEILVEAIAKRRIADLISHDSLKRYLDRFVPPPGLIIVGSEIISEIENFSSSILRVELDDLRSINNGVEPSGRLATPSDLIDFFELLRTEFSELSHTRFHLLFDDAGEPYVEVQVQRAINELMVNSNPLYCVKLTAEKNTYIFETSTGKLLENGHDYYEQDISYNLFIGPRSSGLKHESLEEYCRNIVGLRLRYFEYKSDDIRDYLGQPAPSAVDTLTLRLAQGRRDADYFGWTAVWHIADRTPRNLLELVSEIFAAGGIDQHSKPEEVPIRVQNRAIRNTSEKRLQSISQIPGSVRVNGRNVSLGRKLFDVTVAIGSTFNSYLKQDARRLHKQRVRQHLAIERNELAELRPDAELILQRLVTYGVLDASRLVYARDDRAKKPIYVLNRILCPAFAIGYRRDDHLRLSKVKLEQLLLYPHEFLKTGTRRLRQENLSEPELFGYKFGADDDV